MLIVLLGAALSSAAVLPAGVLPPVNPAARSQYVAVIMWHDVVASKRQVWFDTPVSELRRQFMLFHARHFHVVSLQQLYAHLASGAPLPSQPVALTFDDNYGGLYRYAYPLLREFRYPATFFAHTSYVGVTTEKPHNTWEQLREMQASGLVTVQPQTETHPEDLRTLSDQRLAGEFGGAARVMRQHLGRDIVATSYPNGRYDDRVAAAAGRAGYRLGFMEDWGSAGASKSLLEVHRYSAHRRFQQAVRDLAASGRAR